MRNRILLFALTAVLCTGSMSFTKPADETCKGKFTLAWVYKGVYELFDYESKCHVWIDGKDMGETTASKCTVPNHADYKLKKGTHKIKVVSWVLYNDKWEEFNTANMYIMDAVYEGEFTLKKSGTLDLTFDLDQEKVQNGFK
ncbi:MAG: hypothetical protein JNL57_13140 [Bacteroidetes bacterium]|nr:hypothetical protein [Bacteroidota bacterium]